MVSEESEDGSEERIQKMVIRRMKGGSVNEYLSYRLLAFAENWLIMPPLIHIWISSRLTFFKLIQQFQYRYAEPFDYLLLTVGILLSIVEGCLQGVQAIIFKTLADTLIEGQAKWETKEFDESKFHREAMTAVHMYVGYGTAILILGTISVSIP